MKRGKLALVLLVIFGGIGCDQVTKEAARQHLEGRGTLSYLGDTFRLTYAENHGAFLGLGATLSEEMRTLLFIGLTTLFMVGLLVWLLRRPTLSNLALFAFSLILSGGIGNLIDRAVFDGGVTDFLNIGIGTLRTGIFNVADVWIMLGVFLVALSPEFWAKDQPEEDDDGGSGDENGGKSPEELPG